MASSRHRLTGGRHLGAGRLVRLTQDFYVAPNPCADGNCNPPECTDPDPACCDPTEGIGVDNLGVTSDVQNRRFFRASEVFDQTNGGVDLSGMLAFGAIDLLIPSHTQTFSENRSKHNDASIDNHSATYNIVSNLGYARYREKYPAHDPMTALSYGDLKKVKGLTPSMSLGESTDYIDQLRTADNSGGIDFQADKSGIVIDNKVPITEKTDPRYNNEFVDTFTTGVLDDKNINTADLTSSTETDRVPFDDTITHFHNGNRDPVGIMILPGRYAYYGGSIPELEIGSDKTIKSDTAEIYDPKNTINEQRSTASPPGTIDVRRRDIEVNPACKKCDCDKVDDFDCAGLDCCDDVEPCVPLCEGCADPVPCKCFNNFPICAEDCPQPGDGDCGCGKGKGPCACGDPACEGECPQPCEGCEGSCCSDDGCGGCPQQCGGDCGTICPGQVCPDNDGECTDCKGNPICDGVEQCCDNEGGCVPCPDQCPIIQEITIGPGGKKVKKMKGNFGGRDLVPIGFFKHILNIGTDNVPSTQDNPLDPPSGSVVKNSGPVIGSRDTIVSCNLVLTVRDVYGRLKFVGDRPRAAPLKLNLYKLKKNIDPDNVSCSNRTGDRGWTTTAARNTTDREATPFATVTIPTSVEPMDKIYFDLTPLAREEIRNGDGVMEFMIEAGDWFDNTTGMEPSATSTNDVAMLVEFYKDGTEKPKVLTNVLRGQSPSRDRLARGAARRRFIAGVS